MTFTLFAEHDEALVRYLIGVPAPDDPLVYPDDLAEDLDVHLVAVNASLSSLEKQGIVELVKSSKPTPWNEYGWQVKDYDLALGFLAFCAQERKEREQAEALAATAVTPESRLRLSELAEHDRAGGAQR